MDEAFIVFAHCKQKQISQKSQGLFVNCVCSTAPMAIITVLYRYLSHIISYMKVCLPNLMIYVLIRTNFFVEKDVWWYYLFYYELVKNLLFYCTFIKIFLIIHPGKQQVWPCGSLLQFIIREYQGKILMLILINSNPIFQLTCASGICIGNIRVVSAVCKIQIYMLYDGAFIYNFCLW